VTARGSVGRLRPRLRRRWRGGRLGAIAVVLLLAVYGTGSYFMAEAVTQAERHTVDASPADLGLAFEDVTFPSRDADLDLELSGWWLPAAAVGDSAGGGVAGGAPVIVMVHGIHATRISDEALPLAARYVAAGFDVLMFDLRGHGRSAGEAVSGGYFEQRDLEGAIDYAVARTGGAPIGVLGRSMGAAIGIMTAAHDPRIAALVADSAYADVSDLIAQETARATGLPEVVVEGFVPGVKFCGKRCFDIDIDALAPERAIRNLRIPVLLIHGTADTRVPVAHARRIRDADTTPGTQLWLVDGVDHVEAFEKFPEEFAARTIAYFRRRLMAAATTPSGSR